MGKREKKDILDFELDIFKDLAADISRLQSTIDVQKNDAEIPVAKKKVKPKVTKEVHRKFEDEVIEVPSLKRKNVIRAIKLLKKPKVLPSRSRKLFKICNYSFLSNNIKGYSWNSPMYIIEHITRSILTRNWEVLPDLLLLLMNFSYKSFNSYTKEITFLMMLMNEHDCSDILDSFHKLFFTYFHKRKVKTCENTLWYYNDQ